MFAVTEHMSLGSVLRSVSCHTKDTVLVETCETHACVPSYAYFLWHRVALAIQAQTHTWVHVPPRRLKQVRKGQQEHVDFGPAYEGGEPAPLTAEEDRLRTSAPHPIISRLRALYVA